MDLDLESLSSGAAYALLTRVVVPRPIAWVLSQDAGGRTNLAPFSYFAPVSSRPPLVVISAGSHRDGRPKDTRVNAVDTGAFVVHIAHRALIEPLNDSAAPLAHGDSEVEALGLELAELADFPVPRLAAARVALGCVLHRVVELADTAPALLVGRVTRAWVDDALLDVDAKGRPIVDSSRLDPIARLGGTEYATLGEVIALARKARIER